MNLCDILKSQDLYVVRRVSLNKGEVFNRLGNVKPGALKINEVPNMSMNILGGRYNPSFLKFRTEMAASKNWNGEKKLPLRIYKPYISVLKNFCGLYIPAKLIHKISIPYQASFNKQYKENFPNYSFGNVKNGEIVKDTGYSELIHAPTTLNYWHVVLESISPFSGDPIKNSKNAFNSFACDSLLQNIITVSALPNLPEDLEKIDKKFYLIGD